MNKLRSSEDMLTYRVETGRQAVKMQTEVKQRELEVGQRRIEETHSKVEALNKLFAGFQLADFRRSYR